MIDITQHPEYIQAENIHNLKYLSFKYIGVFNAVSDGRFLRSLPESGILMEPGRQPGQRFLEMAREIKSPEDYRPGTVKGKIDAHDIWVVQIKMPKELIGNFKHGKDEIESQDEADMNTGNTFNADS